MCVRWRAPPRALVDSQVNLRRFAEWRGECGPTADPRCQIEDVGGVVLRVGPLPALPVPAQDHDEAADKKKSRVFRKFIFQGIELDKLMDMSHADVVAMFRSNIRRRFKRGLSRCVLLCRVQCIVARA